MTELDIAEVIEQLGELHETMTELIAIDHSDSPILPAIALLRKLERMEHVATVGMGAGDPLAGIDIGTELYALKESSDE